jgi:hypothetical protein
VFRLGDFPPQYLVEVFAQPVRWRVDSVGQDEKMLKKQRFSHWAEKLLLTLSVNISLPRGLANGYPVRDGAAAKKLRH